MKYKPKKRKSEPTYLEQLESENAFLKMENAFLKKYNALIQQEEEEAKDSVNNLWIKSEISSEKAIRLYRHA